MSRVTRAATVEAPAEGRPIRAVLATEGKKADGIDLRLAGGRLDRYRANPVLLWGHDTRQLPLGRVTHLSAAGGRLTGQLDFSQHNPQGQLAERMVRAGELNAISVGFDVLRWGEGARSRVAEQWRLVEVSLVPVGMDESALVESRARRGLPKDRVRTAIAEVLAEEIIKGRKT